jgi:hypothetical protein
MFKLRWDGRVLFAAGVAAMVGCALPAAAVAGAIAIELNKLEPQKDSCRAYIVVTNNSATAYQVLKLDLVLFQPDGVIGRRFALDLGPLTGRSDRHIADQGAIEQVKQ